MTEPMRYSLSSNKALGELLYREGFATHDGGHMYSCDAFTFACAMWVNDLCTREIHRIPREKCVVDLCTRIKVGYSHLIERALTYASANAKQPHEFLEHVLRFLKEQDEVKPRLT